MYTKVWQLNQAICDPNALDNNLSSTYYIQALDLGCNYSWNSF